MTKKIEFWKTKLMKVKDLMPNNFNPRLISEDKIKKLQKQFKSVGFNNPPKIDNEGVLLGGNQRFKALMEMGLENEEIVVMYPAGQLTEKQRQEVIITDNVNDGSWDFDLLTNDFELDELKEWGLEVPNMELDQEEKDDKDLSDSLASKYILEIECDSEAEQEILYNRFLGEKLKVKILSI